MSLQSRTHTIEIYSLNFKFTCVPEPGEKEYLDTQVYINDNYFCTITWADVAAFIKDIRITVGQYAI
jgi:hypothetical protein